MPGSALRDVGADMVVTTTEVGIERQRVYEAAKGTV